MLQYQEENLKQVCTPTEVKFIKDFERFLKTHKHGALKLFGHSGTLCIEKDVNDMDATVRLYDFLDSVIPCDGGDPNRGTESGDYIDIEDYLSNK